MGWCLHLDFATGVLAGHSVVVFILGITATLLSTRRGRRKPRSAAPCSRPSRQDTPS